LQTGVEVLLYKMHKNKKSTKNLLKFLWIFSD